MKCEDKKQRPVAYISKLLNKAERNYEIHNKEILVIIRCLEAQRYFLEEAKSQEIDGEKKYKNIEQEKYERKTEVFGQIKEIYSGKIYLEEVRELRKYNRLSRRI